MLMLDYVGKEEIYKSGVFVKVFDSLNKLIEFKYGFLVIICVILLWCMVIIISLVFVKVVLL